MVNYTRVPVKPVSLSIFVFALVLRLTDVLSVRNRNTVPLFFLTGLIDAMRAYIYMKIHVHVAGLNRCMAKQKGLLYYYYCSIVYSIVACVLFPVHRHLCYSIGVKTHIAYLIMHRISHRGLPAAWNISMFMHNNKLNVVLHIISTDLSHHANELFHRNEFN